MLKSTLFRRIFTIFFMISLFNMAVFPGAPASYYVVLISKMKARLIDRCRAVHTKHHSFIRLEWKAGV
ncbi:hypothetical protein C6W20_01605 [Bacillus sp. NMCN6]|nr:hypothetical protein C6W21_01600 [Bacillus sp. NMCN1]PRR99749.1 hypothetical protein C6W20_01605 [Bacillus sp. NMCN6]